MIHIRSELASRGQARNEAESARNFPLSGYKRLVSVFRNEGRVRNSKEQLLTGGIPEAALDIDDYDPTRLDYAVRSRDERLVNQSQQRAIRPHILTQDTARDALAFGLSSGVFLGGLVGLVAIPFLVDPIVIAIVCAICIAFAAITCAAASVMYHFATRPRFGLLVDKAYLAIADKTLND